MKTRKGFVSNSSSSSFILTNTNVEQVANSMLSTVIGDWREGGYQSESHQKWRKNLQKGIVHSKVQSGEVGITLPSCNYETYIFKKKGKIYVSTANNHSWDIEDVGDKCYGGGGSDYGQEDEVHRYVEDLDYYDVRNGLIHSLQKHFNYNLSQGDPSTLCPACHNNQYAYVLYKDKELCGTCYKGVCGTSEIIEWESDKEEAEFQRVKSSLKLRESLHIDPIQDIEI